ncbi:hypothetical protein [Sediminitomix flava]|uniref:Regulator of cell morphogenesis and NO signaling n=1 Tax=Sediminitomix flava TaxID=379075 RepID=A0A315ZNW4_SEDFL|nr:hypothetical protein [Sediminitomix flava]PWJ36169.1 regulator of cell morphogenesis and NO signaling [Sediminitomix flava]
MSYRLIHKKLIDLVEENPNYASILYFYGIPFQHYPKHTLNQIVNYNKVDLPSLVHDLQNTHQPKGYRALYEVLAVEDISHIIAYIKNEHLDFIRYHLPFMASLVDNLQNEENIHKDLMLDFRYFFFEFHKSFVEHIKEEEEIVFNYLNLLERILNGHTPMGKEIFFLQKNSIAKFISHHKDDDDDMKGIRTLTDQYRLDEQSPLFMRIFYHELKNFENKLKIHSRIENELLFPKAMRLEQKVGKELERIGKKN